MTLQATLDALVHYWPILVAMVLAVWYIGRYTKTMESLVESMKEFKGKTEEKLEDHESRISKTEQSTTILLNHTGLTGA